MKFGVYPLPIQNLRDLFAKFPGVGPRQAARFVFYLLKEPVEFRQALAGSIASVADALLDCTRCGNIEGKKWSPDQKLSDTPPPTTSADVINGAESRTESHRLGATVRGSLVRGDDDALCSICKDKKRDATRIAVVVDVTDLGAIERTRAYTGLYHVLGESLDTKLGVERVAQSVKKLALRIAKETPQEIIIATDPTYEGDLTARYLERELAPLNVRITHLGRGLAKGVDLEYVDEETLREALAGRH